MKRSGLFILILSLFLVGAAAAQLFYPIYWITGSVDPAADGTGADGQYVYFYKSDEDRDAGSYQTALIQDGKYMLNTYGLGISELDVGEKYFVAIPNSNPADPASGYGAMPVDVTISGKGYDEAPILAYTLGADPFVPPPPPGLEAVPSIEVWFNNRLYQPEILAAGETFVISSTPTIRVNYSIPEPYVLAPDTHVILDPGKPGSQTLQALSQPSALAAELRSLSLTYAMEEPLSEGEHLFQITAYSGGNIGAQSTSTTYATVEVMGGPLRIVGQPLTYPVPFIVRTHKNVTIQYTLSQDADIELTILSVEGRIVKRIHCAKGTEGGSAGINKVQWNGVTQAGVQAGAAVYVGSIVSKEEGRLLAKFRIAIID